MSSNRRFQVRPKMTFYYIQNKRSRAPKVLIYVRCVEAVPEVVKSHLRPPGEYIIVSQMVPFVFSVNGFCGLAEG